MLDCVIRAGTIVDGTGAAGRRGDIGLRGGRIVAVGRVDEQARRTIDADGLVIAPGFIDLHTHYDAQLFWDPAATPSSLHGVTTVIAGNCGLSIAPLEEGDATYLMRLLARVEAIPVETLEAGVPWDWRTFAEFLDRFEGRIGVNAGFLVGHSCVRRLVMGDAAATDEASPEQIEAMLALVHEALDAGSLGFSSSKSRSHMDDQGRPAPSRLSSDEELLTLSAAVREHAGTTLEFIPSIDLFTDRDMELMTAMSLAADRPLNWNALVVDASVPEWMANRLEASDYAARRGARVVALSPGDLMRLRVTFANGVPMDAIPGWSDTMTLPLPERRRVLADPQERRRLRACWEAMSPTLSLKRLLNWENIVIAETHATENTGLAGRTVGDVAADRSQDPFDALLDIVVADDLRTGLLPPAAGDDDTSWAQRVDIWRDPRVVIGASDAGAHLDMLYSFSYFTAMLDESVRRRGLLSLEEAVRLITDVPARLYGLRGRGRMEEGACADLVVFDADRIAPGPVQVRDDLPSGASRLFRDAVGMEHVLVNGTEIVCRGELTGSCPGTVLRSGRDTETVHAASGAAAHP